LLNEASKFGLTQEKLDKEKAVGRLQRENFEKAFKAGVKWRLGPMLEFIRTGTMRVSFLYGEVWDDSGAGHSGCDIERSRFDWARQRCGDD